MFKHKNKVKNNNQSTYFRSFSSINITLYETHSDKAVFGSIVCIIYLNWPNRHLNNMGSTIDLNV